MPLLQFELLPLTGEDTNQSCLLETLKRATGPGLPDGSGYGYGAFDTRGSDYGGGWGDGDNDTSGCLSGFGYGLGGYPNRTTAGTLEGTGEG